jgi:hypothetical protein
LAVVAEVGPVFGGGGVWAPDGAVLHRATVKTAAANCVTGYLAISRSLDWCRIKLGWREKFHRHPATDFVEAALQVADEAAGRTLKPN